MTMVNVLSAAMTNKRRKAMAKSQDDTSAGAVLAGFLSALSDPSKAAEQMATFQATLAEIDARRAALKQEQTALDVRAANVSSAEAKLAEQLLELRAREDSAAARIATAADAEGKLQQREDTLRDNVAQLRVDRKEFKQEQEAADRAHALAAAKLDEKNAELVVYEADLDGQATALALREAKLAKAEADFAARADALRKAISG